MNEKTISEINSFNLLFILIEMCPFNYNSDAKQQNLSTEKYIKCQILECKQV
jgi:hypothetical protein